MWKTLFALYQYMYRLSDTRSSLFRPLRSTDASDVLFCCSLWVKMSLDNEVLNMVVWWNPKPNKRANQCKTYQFMVINKIKKKHWIKSQKQRLVLLYPRISCFYVTLIQSDLVLHRAILIPFFLFFALLTDRVELLFVPNGCQCQGQEGLDRTMQWSVWYTV